MNETQEAEARNGFDIHELENMYLEHLSKYGFFIGKHVTRFGQELLEIVPNYEIINFSIFLPNFVYDFSRKIFVMLYSVN